MGDIDPGAQMRRVGRVASAQKLRLTLLALSGLLVGAAVAAVVPELYESRTIILIRERQLIDDSKLIKAIADKPLAQKEETLAQELRSWRWVNDVLQEVEWLEYAQAKAAGPTALWELVDQVRDPEHLGVSVNTDPAGELLVTLSFRWFDPGKAHDFVLRARKNWLRRRDEESRRYWRRSLVDAEKIYDKYRTDYERAARNLQSFEAENNISFINDDSTDAELKTRLTQTKAELDAEIADLTVRVRGLEEQLAKVEPTITIEVQEKNEEYEARLSHLQNEQKELATLQETHADNHPKVKKQRERVETAEQAFASVKDQKLTTTTKRVEQNPEWLEIKKNLDHYKPMLDSKRAAFENVQRQLSEVDTRLAELPSQRSQLLKLRNDMANAEQLLNGATIDIAPLRDKMQNLEQRTSQAFADSEEALESAGAFEILEDPVPAEDPVGLPRPVFALIGLLVGLGLGLALALLRIVSDSTFEDARDVERGLGLPILGAVGRIATVGELRRERARATVAAFGGILVVASLGAFVWVLTVTPERLPEPVRDALADLREALQ